jgi:hypothetical protein
VKRSANPLAVKSSFTGSVTIILKQGLLNENYTTGCKFAHEILVTNRAAFKNENISSIIKIGDSE